MNRFYFFNRKKRKLRKGKHPARAGHDRLNEKRSVMCQHTSVRRVNKF